MHPALNVSADFPSANISPSAKYLPPEEEEAFVIETLLDLHSPSTWGEHHYVLGHTWSRQTDLLKIDR